MSALGMDVNWGLIVSGLTAVFVVSRVVKYQNAVKATQGLPGLPVLFQNLDLPGLDPIPSLCEIHLEYNVLPGFMWNWPLGEGLGMHWRLRLSFYKRFNADAVVLRPFLKGKPEIYTNNVDIARQVAVGGHKTSYWKPHEASLGILFWGMNLLAADKDVWRKHRRILGEAFNAKLYDLVLEKSMDLYDQMVSGEGWDKLERVELDVVQRVTFKFALLLIALCGFGFNEATWVAGPATEDQSMSLAEAIRIATEDNMLHVFLPKWVYLLPIKRLRHSAFAVKQLRKFMREQVQRRKMDDLGDRSAFSLLVKASQDGNGKFALDDNEVIGNIFVLLFAGHESTAHTIAGTLAYICLDHDLQDAIYDQIIAVLGKDRRPSSVEELYKMSKILESLMEALRLHPAGHILIREAYEDTVLTVPNPVGEEGTYTVPVAKGTRVNVDMIGMQYNPRYFDEPEEFRPSRWEGISPDSEQVTAFSVGARACIGRKFAIIELLSFLTLLLRDWRVEPKLNQGETKEQWKARVIKGKLVMTLGIQDIPVVLYRRA
ncbi:cytochrome P450 [Flagelloscypha sp. PMI_526]|nr:cytochrome P450 [Flagelloscypha sp. PMI_526]